MTDQKITDTIKKLLSLTSSPNENEAKLAMQRAQELIAKYSISLADDLTEPIIETKIDYSHLCLGTSDYAPEIIHIISKIFGVHSVKFTNEKQIALFGFKTNTEVALYASSCVINQLNATLRKNLTTQSAFPIEYIHTYWQNACVALVKRFTEETTVGSGLVVYDKAKEVIEKTYMLRKSAKFTLANSTEGTQDGLRAGNEVQIRSGIQSTNQERKLL